MSDLNALPPDVTGVRVLGRYVLELTFSTGERRIIDLEQHLWGPVFEPLTADYGQFCGVFVDPEAGTIAWPTGADLSPALLYEQSQAAQPA